MVVHTFLLSLDERISLNIFRVILNLSLKFREWLKGPVCKTRFLENILKICQPIFYIHQNLSRKTTLYSAMTAWATNTHTFPLSFSISLLGDEDLGRNYRLVSHKRIKAKCGKADSGLQPVINNFFLNKQLLHIGSLI